MLGRQDRAMESTEREERRREEAGASQRPIAKPRVKVISFILVCEELCELPVMLWGTVHHFMQNKHDNYDPL